MNADLKELHQAVRVVLKARSKLKLALQEHRRAVKRCTGTEWLRWDYIEQLAAAVDHARNQLAFAETGLMLCWDTLAYEVVLGEEVLSSR